ncbi:MAG: S24 family peptidase, partial [Fimbriimonadaceae bacterium]
MEDFPAGLKLKKAREGRRPKISQYDLAEEFLLDRAKRPAVANWEIGKNTPPTAVIKKIAEAWGIPLTWFFDGMDTPVPIQPLGAHLGSGPTLREPQPPYGLRGVQPGVGRRFFPILGRAGAAAFPVESGEPEDYMDFSDDLADRWRDQFVIKVEGDSAKPAMRHHDWVLVTADPAARPIEHYIVVRSSDNGFLVKVLTGQDGDWWLESENAAYPPMKLEEGGEMIGFVVGWKRTATGSYAAATYKSFKSCVDAVFA